MPRRRGAERFRASRGGCVESSARGWRGAARLAGYTPIVRQRQRYQHPRKGCRYGVGRGPYVVLLKLTSVLPVWSVSSVSRPALFRAIMMGKAGTVMPAWGTVLSQQQVADVAEFVYQDFIHPNPDEIEPQPESEQAPQEDKKNAP